MAKNSNFNIDTYDLGTSNDIGLDRQEVSNELLYSASEIPTQCYACTAPNPGYKVMAIKSMHETAELQNGLYICSHCLQQNILDRTIYGIREVK